MKKVPLKNYFILLFILVITVVVVLGAREFYYSRTEKQYTSIMNDFITEVKLEDLDDYTLENSPAVIFISNKKDSSLETQEKQYKDVLIEYDIKHLFVYLDTSVEEEEDILTKFNQKYNMKISNIDLPKLVVVDGGKIVDEYSTLDFNQAEVVNFLMENGVIERD